MKGLCPISLPELSVFNRLDLEKPAHVLAVAAIALTVIAPAAAYVMNSARYHISTSQLSVIEKASPTLASKLNYDTAKHASVFNSSGEKPDKDKLALQTGGGGKKDSQLYTATMPDSASTGITVHDNVNDVEIGFKPQFDLMDGQKQEGRVVYPLKDHSGQMIFTPKANGLKEDILLTSSPGNDASFHYQLEVPDTVSVKLMPDGGVGFYTASPELYGNISYSNDNDQQLVEKARKNAAKDYLMFSIPAPVIKQAKSSQTAPTAKFAFSGKDLSVNVSGLDRGSYPLSIDPTFLISSTSDWVLGSSDDNIDLTVSNQIGRAALSGGSLTAWSTAANVLTSANFALSVAAYNGCLFAIGGGNSASTTVFYTKLSTSTGNTTQAWASTTAFNTGRVGAQAFGYNGYLYVMGGENAAGTTQYATTEYAKINSNCTVGTWSTSATMNNTRAFFSSAIYQGIVYVMGGEQGALNTSLTNTTEYARINGDGSIGSWAATTVLTSARDRFSAGAYNGYVYVTGGLTSATVATNLVQYAAIQSDGSLGSWTSTTAFPTNRRDQGMGIERGHIYIYGGCNGAINACGTTFLSDTEYAVVNADGTVGQWQQTNNTPSDRAQMATTVYNGHLYSVGGCGRENSGANDCRTATTAVYYTSFDTPGRFDTGIRNIQTTPPYSNNGLTTATSGGQSAVLNGFIYYIGGCTVGSCASYSSNVQVGFINDNGSLTTFSTTTALPAGTGNNAGRIGHTVMAFNGRVYVIGGIEKTTGGADAYMNTILYADQGASNGVLGSWATQSNNLPSARAFHASVIWHNKIYVIGGRDSTTVYGTVYYTSIASNLNISTWSTATTSVTARWGHSAAIWGGWIYVMNGQSDLAGTYIAASAGGQQLTLNTTSGDVSSSTSFNSGNASRFASAFVHNGFLYNIGGYSSGNTNATSNIYWASLDSSTGVVGTFSNSNIGGPTAFGLGTARGMVAALAAQGEIFVLGGCSSTMTTTSFSGCTSFVTTTNSIEGYLPNNGGVGGNNAFASTTSLATARGDHATVAYNGRIYIVGGCTAYTSGACSANTNSVLSNSINPNGSVSGSYTTENSLPANRSSLQAAIYNGYIYVAGGRTDSSGASNTVWYAPISNTGAIGTWVDSSSYYLPNGTDRRDFGMAITKGYLFVAGGADASGTAKNDVYSAQLASDGSVGTWNSTTSFTTARYGFGLVAYNGVLYVGGGTPGSGSLTDFQYAPVSDTGTITSWAFTSDQDRGGGSFRGMVAANGYLYVLGNEAFGVNVKYADINANGSLGPFQRTSTVMSTAHPHSGGAFYDGYFYQIGGCSETLTVCNSPIATAEYAGQNAISRTGHYSKLFDTQVDTSPTQLVIGGAISGPGSVVELKFQTASESDTTLGVAQLIRPVVFGNYYTVQALNSAGTNVGVAFNYFVNFTLDDSNSGTFPDVNQNGNQTSVSSILMYYHANPSRRLRHGASFTDTGCNTTPANGCLLDTAP